MADPLSLVASIVALVGAAESVGKVLVRIKNLYNAPDEYLALINELTDLNIILSGVQGYIIHIADRPPAAQADIQNMSTLVDRAKANLLEIEKLVEY